MVLTGEMSRTVRLTTRFDSVLTEAQERGVAVIARVPLASGLLSGKYTMDTVFPENDYRNYNRHGESFDVGETFSGVPYEVGIEAAARFSELCTAFGPAGVTPAQIALKWVTEQRVSPPSFLVLVMWSRHGQMRKQHYFPNSLPISILLLKTFTTRCSVSIFTIAGDPGAVPYFSAVRSKAQRCVRLRELAPILAHPKYRPGLDPRSPRVRPR